jgi:hypothetical protein
MFYILFLIAGLGIGGILGFTFGCLIAADFFKFEENNSINEERDKMYE